MSPSISAARSAEPVPNSALITTLSTSRRPIGEEVDHALGRRDGLVDGGVGLVDDHRHPTIETATGEPGCTTPRRRRWSSPSDTMIDPSPTKKRSTFSRWPQRKASLGVAAELGQMGRIADHDHRIGPAGTSKVAPSSELKMSSVGTGRP